MISVKFWLVSKTRNFLFFSQTNYNTIITDFETRGHVNESNLFAQDHGHDAQTHARWT